MDCLGTRWVNMIKVLDTKAEDLSFIPETHLVEVEKQLPQVSSDLHSHTDKVEEGDLGKQEMGGGRKKLS